MKILATFFLFVLMAIAGQIRPALADDYLCSPTPVANPAARSIQGPSGRFYTLNGSGCAFVSNKTDVAAFISQGFTDLSAITGGAGALSTTCDGSTDVTSQISALGPTSGGSIVPVLAGTALTNYCKTTISQSAFPNIMTFFGSVRVSDSAGNLRGPIYTSISTQPTLLGNYGTSQLQAFNADYSHVPFAIEANIIGTALGAPNSSYTLGRQTASIFIRSFNSAGWNNSTGGGGSGRSGQPSILVDFNNTGAGGDMSPFWFEGICSGVKPGATVFGANSACSGPAGQVKAGADGVYLEPFGDLNAIDGGFDAASAAVINVSRTNATGNLNANSEVYVGQNIGTVPLDSYLRLNGDAMTGIDMTQMGSNANKAVISAPAISAAGTGYLVGDLVALAGGTCVQTPKFYVKTVSGSGIATFGIERRGMCSVFPGNPAALTTVTGAGSGATATVTSTRNVAMAVPPGVSITMNSVCDTGFWVGCRPSTDIGTAYFYYADATGFTFIDNGRIVLEAGKGTITIPIGNQFATQGGRALNLRRVITGTTSDTAAVTDDTIAWVSSTASPKTQNLPGCDTTITGTIYTIKDKIGTAAANNITIIPAAGTIEGAATLVMSTNRQSVALQCDGTDTDWMKIN